MQQAGMPITDAHLFQGGRQLSFPIARVNSQLGLKLLYSPRQATLRFLFNPDDLYCILHILSVTFTSMRLRCMNLQINHI